MYSGITLDGTEYNVRIVYGSLQRDFEIVEGTNTGVNLKGGTIRDVIGTGYMYTMKVEQCGNDYQSYNAFYEAITAPVASHTFVAPYGDTTLSFSASIYSGSDTDQGMVGGHRKWSGLNLVFKPISLQRFPV